MAHGARRRGRGPSRACRRSAVSVSMGSDAAVKADQVKCTPWKERAHGVRALHSARDLTGERGSRGARG